MSNQSTSKLPFGIVAAGLGAIAGALSVLLARKESRQRILEGSAKGLELIEQTGAKVRQHTEGLVAKGRELISGCCATSDKTGKGSANDQHENKPEMH